MKTRKLKVNSDFVAGHKKDEVVTIEVDSNNLPVNRFWRKQMQNAKQDNCCEFVKTRKSKKE